MAEKLHFQLLELFLQIHSPAIQSVFGVTVSKINVSAMLDIQVLLAKPTQLQPVKIKLVSAFKESLTGQLNIHLLTCTNKAVVGFTFWLKEDGVQVMLINLKSNSMLMDIQLICHPVSLLEL